MTRISLRDYLSGIDEMIDGGQIEEAVAHCRHILKSFPKHVDTYRMLGKAYLEAKRNSEAGDIFQRVLSSVPDDFVAHVGMSIIREDEGNLDAAIWHMERAFEAQPSNRAVQDELRRLYGEREGFQPPKVRLTRGALARMYAHGDLYAQAISELRGALSGDVERSDLMVLLARMYYLTNRQNEAMEVCKQLIEKLPYCLYANHLMADMLSDREHAAEADIYLKRVRELDPYAAQTSTLEPAESIPGNTVMVESLITERASRISAAGGWTGALPPAEEPESYAAEDLPDWLSISDEELEAAQEPEEEPPVVDDSTMDELTYLSPTGELKALDAEDKEQLISEPQVAEEGDEDLAAQAGELDDADIPDWLRELQPSDAGEVGEAGDPGSARELDAASLQSEPQVGTGELEAEQPPEDEDEEGLRWLETLAAKQGADEDELLSEPEARDEDKPDWLKTPEEKAAESAGSLDWLDELAAETEADLDDTGEVPAGAPVDEPQDQPSGAPAFVDSDAEEGEIEDSTPQWLRDLAAEAEAAPGTDDLSRADLDKAPDWLDELRPTETDEFEEDETDQESWEDEAGAKLDWLEELGSPKGQGTQQLDEWDVSEVEEPEEAKPGLTRSSPGDWVPERELDGGEAHVLEPGPRPDISPEPEPVLEKKEEPDHTERLEAARAALGAGDLKAALDSYGKLVRSRKLLEDVIDDLERAVESFNDSVELHQLLGDAYMREDRLRDALESYSTAEELL